MIQPDLAKLVDDDGGSPEPGIAQDTADQRRLAASQKAGNDGDRDQAFGTATAGAVPASGPCRGWCAICSPPGFPRPAALPAMKPRDTSVGTVIVS
jgi:hypothetical protein